MDNSASFGYCVRRRRKALDLTQAELAKRVSSAVVTIRRIEADERRPSRQVAELLAEHLQISAEERPAFLKAARAELAADWLLDPTLPHQTAQVSAAAPTLPLPSGTVTFLFTDIEGSTKLWEQHPQAMEAALAQHHALLREAIEAQGGVVFQVIGDAFCAAFATAPAALRAALAAQRALRDASWGSTGSLRVRMAVHTATVALQAGDYPSGPHFNRLARLLSAGHGGQTLLSAATHELLREHLPPDATLHDLGAQRLKDLSRPEQIFQLGAPDLPAAFPPLKTLDRSRHNLPAQATALIGREPELATIDALLREGDVRLITLTGPGGTGKTRLALQAAADLQDYYADGIWFVDLAPIADPQLVAPEVARALGVPEAREVAPEEQLRVYLHDKHLLLLLDNFEQVLDAAPLVSQLLRAAPALVILVTSRAALHISAEHEYPIDPLGLPDIASLSAPGEDVVRAVAYSDAVRLFIARAQAVKPDFALTEANATAVATICAQLDGLPLAIELAAARVKLFPPQALLAHLSSAGSLATLTGGARDLPARQQTIRDTIAWSYHLLTADEQMLFARLGVFVGGFTLDAAEVIASESRIENAALNSGDSGSPMPAAQLTILHSVEALLNHSLARLLPGDEAMPFGEQRFFLLETIREFAVEQLRAHGEETLLRERHYAAYLQLFRTADSYLRGAEAATWLARVEPDQDNLRAALQWTLDTARYADAAWLMVAVHYCWFLRGSRYEGTKWLVQLLPYRQTLATDLHLATLICFYSTAFELEEFPPVDRYTGEVKELLEVCSDKLLQAAAWFWLGWSATDVAQAVALVEQCIALARAASEVSGLGTEFGAMADHTFLLAAALEHYAANLIDQGELARAATVATESLALFRMRGNPYGIGHGLGTLGRLALLQGDITQAHRLLHEVVTLATSLNLRPTQSEWQPLLGIVTLYGGNAPEARRLLSASWHLCLELKNKFFLARACTYLAELALWEGEVAQAEHWLAQSLDYLADPQRITIFQVTRLFVAARVATAQQQYVRAATLFGLADQVHGYIHYAIAGPMRALADVALAMVQAALDPVVFAEAFATGQQVSLEEAFATILAPMQLASVATKA